MNLKLCCLVLSLLCVFGCVGRLNAESVSGTQSTAKPQSPVTVSIQAVKESPDGNAIDFVVSATSQINAQQFALIVYPPKDMQLTGGALSWRGPLQRGQSKTLQFSAAFKQRANQQILVNAVIQNQSGPRFSARASYVVGAPSGDVKAFTATPSGDKPQGVQVPRGNHTVIEYPVTH